MQLSRTLARYLPTFVMVANELSFSAVARQLNVTPAAVSKNVRALERELGSTLFHRSTRALRLTDDGEQLQRRIAPMMVEMEQALAGASNQEERPRGRLRVTLPETFGRLYVVPLLAEFCERYPEVELELLFDDTSLDLVRERIDVAIGLRTEPRLGLVGRRLCASRFFTLAAPDFIAERGAPEHPTELTGFPCLAFRQSSGRRMPWRYVDGDEELVVRPPIAISATSLEALNELAARGHGITRGGWMSLPYLRAGRLVPVLAPYEWQPPPMMLYHRIPENMPSRARVFIDHIVARFAPPSWP